MVLVYVRDWRCDGRSGAYGVTAAHKQLVGKVAGVVGGMAWAAHVTAKHFEHARDTGRVQNQRPVEIICQLPGVKFGTECAGRGGERSRCVG